MKTKEEVQKLIDEIDQKMTDIYMTLDTKSVREKKQLQNELCSLGSQIHVLEWVINEVKGL